MTAQNASRTVFDEVADFALQAEEVMEKSRNWYTMTVILERLASYAQNSIAHISSIHAACERVYGKEKGKEIAEGIIASDKKEYTIDELQNLLPTATPPSQKPSTFEKLKRKLKEKFKSAEPVHTPNRRPIYLQTIRRNNRLLKSLTAIDDSTAAQLKDWPDQTSPLSKRLVDMFCAQWQAAVMPFNDAKLSAHFTSAPALSKEALDAGFEVFDSVVQERSKILAGRLLTSQPEAVDEAYFRRVLKCACGACSKDLGAALMEWHPGKVAVDNDETGELPIFKDDESADNSPGQPNQPTPAPPTVPPGRLR